MNKKNIGTILGVAGVLLWFMPLINLMDMNMHQAGNHIGGIAYLMLFASMSYAVLSWLEQHVPRMIAASVALAISLLFLAQVGSSAAWGLYGIIGVSFIGLVIAFRDKEEPMGGKGVGTILGVTGMILWFMPMVNFIDMNLHQAGNHIGGIAYLMLFASLAYAIFSWIEQHVPRVIAASVVLAISLLFLVQVGSSAAWGLFGFIVVSIVGIVMAIRDNRAKRMQTN
jgi:hypothetical protein